MKYIVLWIISSIILIISNSLSLELLLKISIPLIVVLLFSFFYQNTKLLKRNFISYILFFLISLTSLFGFTETLTGTHAESSNPFLYGFSFYTASIAYYLSIHKRFSFVDAFKIANPLLLITGPIALFIRPIKHKKFTSRFNYFAPFFLVGLFFYQIIAIPLTEFLYLIKLTDIVSALVFAFIFEIFIYTNFAGLSLILYGVFGMLGYKIPLNFKQPFSSSNMVDFWKGWHISLSSVLKILFYIPLRKRFSVLIAALGVFLASAFWHGVTVNFLIWGIFHALIFWLSIELLKRNIKIFPSLFMIGGIVIGRLIFADSNTERLIKKLTFDYDGSSIFNKILEAPETSLASLFIGIILISIEFLFRDFKSLKKRNYKHLRSPVIMFVLSLIGLVLIAQVGVNYAVYGQR